MKGVTRVTASLLAAAMTAGLGTTAVFADNDQVGVVTDEQPTATETANYIEVKDVKGNLLAGTNKDEEKYYDYDGTDKQATGAVTELTMDLHVGGVKTLSANLDPDATSSVKWSYKDSAKDDSKITDDDLDEEGKNPETAVLGLDVTGDTAKLTAKKPGRVVIYAFANSAVVAKEKPADGSKPTDQPTKVEGNVVKITVTVENTSKPSIEFANVDNKYVDTDYNQSELDSVKKASNLKTLATPNSASKLKYHGNKLINHVDAGSDAEVVVRSNDDSDYNPNLILASSANNDSAKALSISGTTVTVGTYGNSGIARVFAYYDDNANKTKDTNEIVSNHLLLAGSEGVKMYRLYNPNTGEHFFTKNYDEMTADVEAGWQYEGVGWYAPSDGTPVYRLYNPNAKGAGTHHYTTNENEYKALVKAGWSDEGVGWYSASKKFYPVYRQYNENNGAHNYSAAENERLVLTSLGWNDEGVGWYALAVPASVIDQAVFSK